MTTDNEPCPQCDEKSPQCDEKSSSSDCDCPSGEAAAPAMPPPPKPAAPPLVAPPPPATAPSASGSGLEALIPMKNPMALSSYYIGLFSLLPLIGLPMGVVAVVLGILGLKAVRANPAIKGATHAWVGIICGGFWALVYGASLAFLVASAIWHF